MLKRYRVNLTEGERSVLLAYAGITVLGTILAFSIVNQLGGDRWIIRDMGFYDFWCVLAGALGAPCGLHLGRDWLGQDGTRGLRTALLGLPIITITGAVCGGTLALPVYGTMFAPFSVAVTFWTHPLLAMFWAANLLAAHYLFLTWRRERDSIFAPPPDDGIPA